MPDLAPTVDGTLSSFNQSSWANAREATSATVTAVTSTRISKKFNSISQQITRIKSLKFAKNNDQQTQQLHVRQAERFPSYFSNIQISATPAPWLHIHNPTAHCLQPSKG